MLDLSDAFARFPVLETPRLILRELTPDDTADTFRIMSDPQVARYFGSPPMATVEAAAERIARIRDAFLERSGIRWAITRREGGAYLGSCGFWRIVEAHYRAEVGYELAAEAWGQGYMPEAVGAALGFAFTRMGLHSVEAQIDPENNGSRRVLEKLGFVQEAYFRQNYYLPEEGRFSDTAVFSLLKPDWQALRAARRE